MNWSDWRPFPDPRKGEYLQATFGAGLNELRLKSTGELILVGIWQNVAWRMTSLLPMPLGRGSRNNIKKRESVFTNLADIEYRTRACLNRDEAVEIEREMLGTNRYFFPT